jgi:hypothetical protein
MGDGVVTFTNPIPHGLPWRRVPSAQCTVASIVDGVQRLLAHAAESQYQEHLGPDPRS